MEKHEQAIALIKQELPQLKAILGLTSIPGQNVEVLAESEISYLQAIALTKPEIYECEPISIVLALKSVLKQNLTLDPYAGLVYIKTRSINVGTKDAPIYKKGLEIQPSCEGLISIARQYGRILDIKRPEVVENSEGRVIGVSVDLLLPSTPAPRWETFKYNEGDFKRWREASNKENGRSKADANDGSFKYASKHYTSYNGGIDPEFARAKSIRHALKKKGTNSREVAPRRIELGAPLVSRDKDLAATRDDITDAEIISETKPFNSNIDLPGKNDL